MKLFVDDEREPLFVYGEGGHLDWIIVRSVEAAKQVLLTGKVESISLDHDLGSGLPTGYDLCKWMSKECLWPEDVAFHSMNNIGAANMEKEWEFYLKHIDEYKALKGQDDY